MKKQISILLVLVLTLSVLAGCGAAAKDTAAEMVTEEASWDYKNAELMEEEMWADDAAYDSGFAPEPEAPAAEMAGGEAEDIPDKTPDFAEKVIYTADVSMETITFDDTVKQVEALVRQYGGFLETSDVDGIGYSASYYKSQTYRQAYFTIRVPVENYTALTDGFSDMGHVTSLSSHAENVTSQYTDVESHITAYRTEEEALLKMMEKAEEVSDLIEIEGRLADVRWEIEYYTSTLRNLDNRISYSTVNLRVNEVKELTEVVVPQLSYWEEMWQGFLGSLKNVGRFFRNLLSGFVQALPVLILVGVILFLVIFFIVRGVKKKKAKKAAMRKAAAQYPVQTTPPAAQESRKE